MLSNNSEKNKHMFKYILIVICISCIIFAAFGINKRISYADEIFTYTITNAQSAFVQFPINEWQTGYDVAKSFMHDSSDSFGQMINSVRFDKVHPPLYYTLLYFLFSVFKGSTSIWIPLLLNFIFYIGSIILVYCLSYKMLKNPMVSAVISLLFACNIGVLSSAMFIRMYMTLTFWVLAFIYVNYLLWENRKRWYLYPLIMVITICGFLTQYYFALFAIGCYITEFIYSIVKKKYISLALYTISMMASVVISTVIWREWKSDLLENVHSQSMIDKTKSIAGTFFNNIPKSIQFLFGASFRKAYLVAFIIITAGVIFIVFSKKIKSKYDSDIRFTLVKVYIAAIFNAFVITEMAPDYLLSYRYYYAPAAAMVFTAMLIIFMCVSILDNKKIYISVFASVSVMLILLNVITISINKLEYYIDAKEYDNNIAFLEEYKDIPWVIGGNEDWIIRNHLEQFMIPDNVIIVNDDTPAGKDEILENAEEILVFGYDDNKKFSDAAIKYYVGCTGNGYEEQKIMVWNSLHVYLVKKQ